MGFQIEYMSFITMLCPVSCGCVAISRCDARNIKKGRWFDTLGDLRGLYEVVANF
jgi:hypothetical protein